MNIAVDLSRFTTNNVLYLDPTNNIIINGTFAKINYITEWFTMNGVYLMFPIEITAIEGVDTKMVMKYNPHTYKNTHLIQDLMRIEHRLLDNYLQTKVQSRRKKIVLSKQLSSGSMKIYKEKAYMEETGDSLPRNKIHYMIKISGIWETANECGITYKLFECHSYME